MSQSKADLIGQVVAREVNEAINGVIADCPESRDILVKYKRAITSQVEGRLQRTYVMLELMDIMRWLRRSVVRR